MAQQDREFALNQAIIDRIQTVVANIGTQLENPPDDDGDSKIDSAEFKELIDNIINILKGFKTEIGTDESPQITGSGYSFKGIRQGSTTLDLSRIEATLEYKSWIGHKHTADVIAEGILPVKVGGTGVNSVAKNLVFSGPKSGNNAAPAWRALVPDDIPNLDATKITSGTLSRPLTVSSGTSTNTITGTGAFVSNTSEDFILGSTFNTKAVDLDHAGVTTSSGTTYNNITQNVGGYFRLTDVDNFAYLMFGGNASANGSVTARMFSRDRWGSVEDARTGIAFTTNAKTTGHQHSYALYGSGVTVEDFYRGIRPKPAHLGILYGTITDVEVKKSDDGVYIQYIPDNDSQGNAVYFKFEDLDAASNFPEGWSFNAAPVILLSVRSGINPSSENDKKGYTKALSNITIHVASVSKTQFRLRLYNYNHEDDNGDYEDLKGQKLVINWLAIGPVAVK